MTVKKREIQYLKGPKRDTFMNMLQSIFNGQLFTGKSRWSDGATVGATLGTDLRDSLLALLSDVDVLGILPDDEKLVGSWPLNEGAGSDAEDLSGNGNHLTLRGSMTDSDWIASISGQGLDLDGSDDYLDKASPSFIDDTKGSVSLWVKFDNTTQLSIPFSISVDGSADDELYIQYRGDIEDRFNIVLRVNGSDSLELRTNDNAITDTNWHHLALTSDGSKIRF